MILRRSSLIVLVILTLVHVEIIESQISGAEHLCDMSTVCEKDTEKKITKLKYFVYGIRTN